MISLFLFFVYVRFGLFVAVNPVSGGPVDRLIFPLPCPHGKQCCCNTSHYFAPPLITCCRSLSCHRDILKNLILLLSPGSCCVDHFMWVSISPNMLSNFYLMLDLCLERYCFLEFFPASYTSASVIQRQWHFELSLHMSSFWLSVCRVLFLFLSWESHFLSMSLYFLVFCDLYCHALQQSSLRILASSNTVEMTLFR